MKKYEVKNKSSSNNPLIVNYHDVFEYLACRLSYDEMIKQIKTHSRQYAKRQLTWFRRDKRVTWFDLDKNSNKQILSYILNNFIKPQP